MKPGATAAVPTPAAVPPLAELAAHPERVNELAPDQARALLAELATLHAPLLARALAVGDGRAATTEPDRLLTVPEAAARLSIPESYLYELVRLGRVEARRIGPKYVRLHPSTVAEIQRDGLDSALSQPYSQRREGRRARSAAEETRAHATGLRGAPRRPREHAGALRARRARDPGTGGTARDDAGGE
jgi:excisionase family DNA binding protein